ncbi:helix-turn-helix domain-containing protein [Vibrio alginolyticus]|uniref:helix-turn-helix domain-containing protein n=1 Tax=Vibrio alginolyticus TaxID=663 RepID=UPI001BD22287|nr:helix-turn-helix domain-containing protein [Vibrio alginolyticus]ELA8260370.1 helix-turn-helix domain-containing protein [Vibrio alginolyticus]MBS9829750.1 helix-turn-helix domain-containing protein [Vibrio alginolyticus]MBS9911151.1 helix-turn-helix domain-containing protein [Vibrio alginolyticus]MBT0048987.1 helix-turn-helix domain-containing protein [Vibrio alginolyticus]MBT0062910.1 helix-turn-helix domain-containing protein [Vibrio alginolyticus]
MSAELAIFDYIKGEAFTDKLKEINGVNSLGELAQIYGVPKTTFSTWNSHNRNSHELVVRTHLRTGIPVKELILPNDYPETELHHSFWGNQKAPEAEVTSSSPELQNPQLAIVAIKSFCLTNGQLVPTGEIPYAQRMFNSWDLEASNTIEIETNDGRFLVDKKQNDAVSGEYLIDMNGRLSINHIQRLPNKLAVVFGNSTVEVSEEDIKVIGRVAVSLEKN